MQTYLPEKVLVKWIALGCCAGTVNLLVPRSFIECSRTHIECSNTQFSTARSRISVAANRKPFCARWQVSASSEHLAQVPGACLRSWQPARPPHTTRRKTQGEAKVQIWSWMMRQTSCFRSCQTPMTLALPWVSAGQCCVRIRCRSGRGSAAAQDCSTGRQRSGRS